MKKFIKSAEGKMPRGFHHELVERPQQTICVYVRDGYTAVPCTGAAHSNAFIDNCMVCLNHQWGIVPKATK